MSAPVPDPRPASPASPDGPPPRVSILMAVHDGMPYLAETLDDLLAQTMDDFELVAVDDASRDDSLAVLREYASRDPRIVVLANPENLKLASSLNRGLARCRAPLIARADADDRYPPDRLEKQVRFMDRNPDVGLLSCAVQKIDEQGVPYATTRFPTEDGPIRMRELFVNSFSHPGAMFRAALVREVGGYDPHYFAGEDADLWARLRARARAANLAEPLVFYRVIGTSMMRTRSDEGKRRSLSVRQRLLADYLGRPVTLEEAGELVTVFHAREAVPPSGQVVANARRGLREVLARARERESADTVRYFRREVARAFRRHAFFPPDPRRAPEHTLLMAAIRWDPRLVRSRPVIKRLVASLLPDRLESGLRSIRSRLR